MVFVVLSIVFWFVVQFGNMIKNAYAAGGYGGYDPTVLAFFENLPYGMVVLGVLLVIAGLAMAGQRRQE